MGKPTNNNRVPTADRLIASDKPWEPKVKLLAGKEAVVALRRWTVIELDCGLLR